MECLTFGRCCSLLGLCLYTCVCLILSYFIHLLRCTIGSCSIFSLQYGWSFRLEFYSKVNIPPTHPIFQAQQINFARCIKLFLQNIYSHAFAVDTCTRTFHSLHGKNASAQRKYNSPFHSRHNCIQLQQFRQRFQNKR